MKRELRDRLRPESERLPRIAGAVKRFAAISMLSNLVPEAGCAASLLLSPSAATTARLDLMVQLARRYIAGTIEWSPTGRIINIASWVQSADSTKYHLQQVSSRFRWRIECENWRQFVTLAN
jgi:hypothetical protein